MGKTYLTLLVLGILFIAGYNYFKDPYTYPTKLDKLKKEYSKPRAKKTDHSKYAELQKDFKTPQEVTRACLTCHQNSADEIMKNPHWTWERPIYVKGKGIAYLGKKNVINNFCISTIGNTKSCGKCHIGYDMSKKEFSYKKKDEVDCLVCHDQSLTYVKGANMGGDPAPNVDLKKVAQSVGRPTRDNCGVCHFFGGGGNNVKHGDLEKAQFHPTKDIDIHMADAGANLVCVDCHKTEHHDISGKLYSIEAQNIGRATCEECHTETPHNEAILNEHTLKVACQTCHIPIYAKVNSVNTYWDWSTAGKLDENGKPFMEEDSLGNHIYKSIKGSFKYARKIKPEYTWFNGTAGHYLPGDKIPEGDTVVVLNPFYGSYGDRFAKIIPVRSHITRQPFDPVTRMLIYPYLYADKKGEGAYWKDFDWDKACELGMKHAGLPYSGKHDFIETVSYWKIDHMVSPKEETVKCEECHTPEGSRIENLKDFYMPGRDRFAAIDQIGKLLILLTILGVLGHGAARYILTRKKKA
jgi:octaheme c-type cytochrome (tetrathionate reductase family)